MAVLNAASQAAQEHTVSKPGLLGKPKTVFEAKSFASKLGLIPLSDCPADFQTAWKAYAKAYWKIAYLQGQDALVDALNVLAVLAHNGHANPNLKSTTDIQDLEETSYAVEQVAAKYHVTINH